MQILLYFGSIWVRCIYIYFFFTLMFLYLCTWTYQSQVHKALRFLEGKKLFTMFTPGGQIKGKSMQPIREKARNCQAAESKARMHPRRLLLSGGCKDKRMHEGSMYYVQLHCNVPSQLASHEKLLYTTNLHNPLVQFCVYSFSFVLETLELGAYVMYELFPRLYLCYLAIFELGTQQYSFGSHSS